MIVEDESVISMTMSDVLVDFGYEVTGIAVSFDEAIELIQENEPDLAILDVQLKGTKTGIDIAKYILNNYHFPYIFLTSFSDRKTLSSAFEVEPSAFLNKPYTNEGLYAAIEIAISSFEKEKKIISFRNKRTIKYADDVFVKQSTNYVRFEFSEILFVKSENVNIEIFLTDGTKLKIRDTLTNFSKKLPFEFQRTHLRFIVNSKRIQSFDTSSIIMKNYDDVLPLSKKYKNAFLLTINK